MIPPTSSLEQNVSSQLSTTTTTKKKKRVSLGINPSILVKSQNCSGFHSTVAVNSCMTKVIHGSPVLTGKKRV